MEISIDPSAAVVVTEKMKIDPLIRKYATPVDFNAYLSWRQKRTDGLQHGADIESSTANASPSQSQPDLGRTAAPDTENLEQPPSMTGPEASYPTSFSEIVELISSGQPISGIKEIPDTILEGQSSQTEKTRRKKPWERDDAAS